MLRTLRYVIAIVIVGVLAGCAGQTSVGGFSVDVDGVQTGYVNGCNQSGGPLAFTVVVSTPVHYSFSINGVPAGEGFAQPTEGFDGFQPGNYLAYTPPPPIRHPAGTCVSMTLRDVDNHGFFTFTPRWFPWCCN